MDINRLGKMPTLEDTIKMKDWKKDILTIPNILSLLRLLMIPIYLTIYLRADTPADYALSAAILAVSCITDLLDGYIARRFHMISTVGKLLDPIADKFTQLVLTICLSLRYPVMRPVLILFLAKEFFQFFAALLNYRKGKALDGALMAGKICTTVLFTSFTALVLIPNMAPGVVDFISFMDCLCLMIAFIQYIFAFCGKHALVHDIEK